MRRPNALSLRPLLRRCKHLVSFLVLLVFGLNREFEVNRLVQPPPSIIYLLNALTCGR